MRKTAEHCWPTYLCVTNMLQRCTKQQNIVGQHIYASPTCCRDAQNSRTLLANIFMRHQHVVEMHKTAEHCWPTYLCVTNMLQRCAKQQNIVGQHIYASPTCCRDAQNSRTLLANIFMRHQHVVEMHKTAEHCWPTYLCVTNMLQRCTKQQNIVGQHIYASPTCCRDAQSSTTLLANIFMRHQHVVEMHKTAEHCWPTYLCVTNMLQRCTKQQNIVGQHIYASPTCCRDAQNSRTLLANIFMRHQHVVEMHKTAEHCWPTYLCVTNMLQRCAKQQNIVGQHIYASPTCCRDAQNSRTLLANIFMRHQHVVEMHKTAEHCWPTYLCVTNMLQRCTKQQNIVGQHIYASPTCCRDAQSSTTLLANIFMRHQHVVEMHKTAEHCWPTYLCVTNMLQRYANGTTLLANDVGTVCSRLKQN